MGLFGRKKKNETAIAEESASAQVRAAVPEPEPEPLNFAPRPMSMSGFGALLLDSIPPLRPFGVQLFNAWGLTASETVLSDLDVPTYSSARLAGYAVRSADLASASLQEPVVLRVSGEVTSDKILPVPLPDRAAVKIAPGMPIPQGADAVLARETVSEALESGEGIEGIVVLSPVPAGSGVRAKGSDVTEGDEIVAAGQRISAPIIGALAEVGINKVLVRPVPRVVVINVDDHLVEPGEPLRTIQDRYDAATSLVSAAARSDGAQVYTVTAVGSQVDEVRRVIADQLIRADLIITLGGLTDAESALRVVGPELGEAIYADIQAAPGGVHGFVMVKEDETPVIMLPGDPVTAFVSYLALVAPVIKTLASKPANKRTVYQVKILGNVEVPAGQTRYLPGVATADGVSILGDPQRPLLADFSGANALIVLTPDVRSIGEAPLIECWMISEQAV